VLDGAQKSQFDDRLKRIERNPGNGRAVTPGAHVESDTKRRKGRSAPKAAPRKRQKVKSKPGLTWLFGFVMGVAMFAAWIKVYPGMETPQNWSASSLPIDPKLGGGWIAFVLIFGLTLIKQFNLRMGFVMLVGLLMGGLGLAGLALAAPDMAQSVTSERFVASVQGIAAGVEWE